MALDPDIFKAYDIRGVYGEQIDGDLAEQIGRAFARVLAGLSGKPTADLSVALAHDMRLSAPELAVRYRDGLTAEGVHVLDAGQAATEVCYYLVGSHRLDGGLICTASHNPASYTGAKLIGEGALALSGDTGIMEVYRKIEAGLGRAPGGGTYESVDWHAGYAKAILEFVDPSAIRGLRVVLDGGNGMAGPTVGPLLEQMELELVECYWKPDGNFPDHEPNPLLPENREFIIAKVREEHADLGIAFDGDGDRIACIDERGQLVDGDGILAILALHLGVELVCVTQMTNLGFHALMASRGIRVVTTDVGDRHVLEALLREGGVLGGEQSGHVIYLDGHVSGDGLTAGLLLCAALRGRPLSEAAAVLERYPQAQQNVQVVSKELTPVLLEAVARLSAELDGSGRVLVRPSGTEPLVRVLVETRSAARAREACGMMASLVQSELG